MFTEEHKKKLKEAWKKRSRKPFSDLTKKRMSESKEGEKNSNWKGGTIKHVVKKVKDRDEYTCKKCGLVGKDIVVVDHIKPRYIRPDLYIHEKNLQTLCPNCHARKTTNDRKEIAVFKRLRTYIDKNRYQNSVCRRGWMHDFRQVKETDTGFLERCTRCGLQIHFPSNIPNHIYLSYHVKSALQPGEPLYKREYPNNY